MASRSLDRMVPVVAEKAERLVEAMSGEVLIYCTARHESEQAALWRHGRPGWLIRHRMRQLYDRADALERGTKLPTDREVALAKASALLEFTRFDVRLTDQSRPRSFAERDSEWVALFLKHQAWVIDDVGPQRGSRRVTNALPLASAHQHGVAFEAVPYLHGKCMWGDKKAITAMGEYGEEAGLEWAGRWTGFKEQVHFQEPGWMHYVASGGGGGIDKGAAP